MPIRDRYPAGVPCWVDTEQPDAEAGRDFYAGLFGWRLEDVMPPGAPGHYFEATLDGGTVAGVGSAQNPAAPATWTTYIAVEDADEAAARVREAGGTVTLEPVDVSDAGRTAGFADPAGVPFSVWQAARHIGAQVVNVPGGWNWSQLATNDLEGAQRFYGAVFSWEFSPTDMGGIMVRRPGYAEYLESIDPGVTALHRAGGAPEGFTDCVAWFDRVPGDGRPGWNVTFSVPDADAAAARAAELGAEILAEPFDVPWQRLVVIRDPQGAHLTLSQFKPPA